MVYHHSVLTRTMYPFVSWSRAILVEPMFAHPAYEERMRRSMVAGVLKRRDVWSTHEEAHIFFRGPALKSWDARSIDFYTVRIPFYTTSLLTLIGGQRCGLRELPTLAYPDKMQGVTLSCTKVQEAVRCRVAYPSKFSF